MFNVGSNRRNGALRAVGLVIYAAFWVTIGWILALLVVIVGVADILIQVAFNWEGFTDKNPVAHVWDWNRELVGWLLWDKNERPAIQDAKPKGRNWIRR